MRIIKIVSSLICEKEAVPYLFQMLQNLAGNIIQNSGKVQNMT